MILVAGTFEPPTINDFFPGDILFKNTCFAIDRLTLIRFIAAGVLLIIMISATMRARLVPRGVQNIVEMMIDFVYKNIAEEILGKKYARKHLPLLVTIFLLILFLNITAVIPFMNISSNGRVAMPLLLALVGYFAFIIAGVRARGLKYFVDAVVVKDVKKILHVLLVPIEFVSNFILRPFTLTVRLMANMLAGHMVLALFFIATSFFFFSSTGAMMKGFGLGSLFFALVFTLFEILVAFLQAYIFSLLVAVYIDGSIHAGEH